MIWLKKQATINKWQFFVVDNKRKGYRINQDCQPLWETPEGVSKFFLGTKQEAIVKSQELFEKWNKIFGVYPNEVIPQEYSHIEYNNK